MILRYAANEIISLGKHTLNGSEYFFSLFKSPEMGNTCSF